MTLEWQVTVDLITLKGNFNIFYVLLFIKDNNHLKLNSENRQESFDESPQSSTGLKELEDLRKRLCSIESRRVGATGSIAALLTWDIRFDSGKK
jgi:hypothetical protein